MSELFWKYVKPLQNVDAIQKFEDENSISFPEDLKEILLKFNGGRPSMRYYDIGTEKDKEFKTLLSFNKTDVESVYKYYPLDTKEQKLIPFASDPSGNYFVLKENTIFLWNHEKDMCIFLANNFTEFLKTLHD